MTPEQEKLVAQFFEEVVPPLCTEPFYFDLEDFEALRTMWEEYTEILQAKREQGANP
jgi:hypothetical protein